MFVIIRNMNTSTTNLLQGEREAHRIVAEAKNNRSTNTENSKVEAQAIIQKYKGSLDEKYEQRK